VQNISASSTTADDRCRDQVAGCLLPHTSVPSIRSVRCPQLPARPIRAPLDSAILQ
jgi:hypothetical protein